MGEPVELSKQFKNFLRDVHEGLERPCWFRFVTILDKDCPNRHSLPRETIDLMTEDQKKEYNKKIRKLGKMMKLSLQQFIGLKDDEFEFLLKHCGIKNASGKWNTQAAENFLDGIPKIGKGKLVKNHPWQELKCGERWWIRLGEGDGFKNVRQQLQSEVEMPPRIIVGIDDLRRDLKRSVRRFMDAEERNSNKSPPAAVSERSNFIDRTRCNVDKPTRNNTNNTLTPDNLFGKTKGTMEERVAWADLGRMVSYRHHYERETCSGRPF